MMRFWSPVAAPAGRMPGVTSRILIAHDLAQVSTPLRANRRDHRCRAHGPARARGLDQIGHAETVTRRMEESPSSYEVSTVTARSFRSETTPVRRRASARRLHGLRIGVHGQKGSHRAMLRFRHTRAPTVLPMSCSLRSMNTFLAGACELHEPRAIRRHKRAGSRSCKNVTPRRRAGQTMASAVATLGRSSAHDQAVAGADGRLLHVTSHHALGNVDQLPRQRLQRLDIGRMLQPVPVVIGFVGE